MKKHILLFTLLWCCALLFGSCESYLEVTPDKSGSAYIYHMDQLYGLTGSTDLYLSKSTDADMAITAGYAEGYMSEQYLLNDFIELTPDYYFKGGVSPMEAVNQYGAYKWSKDVLKDLTYVPDFTWNPAWKRIYTLNTVLENLDKVTQTTTAIRNQVEGEARFGRAYYHFMLLTQYCQWDENAPGIGYREDTQPNGIPERQTVKYTLEKIYEDLRLAQDALQKAGRITFDFKHNTRPTVPTVQAFRARVDLYRGNYPSALENAEAALAAHSELVDIKSDPNHVLSPFMPLIKLDEEGNLVSSDMGYLPLQLQSLSARAILEHKEVYLPSVSAFTYWGLALPISTSFYDLWTDKENDARWKYFYNSYYSIFISPSISAEALSTGLSWTTQQWLRPADYHTYFHFFLQGSVGQIIGMTTAEMYLIKAECMARTGASEGEVADVLKTLRRTRFLNDVAADHIGGTLEDVLNERGRELGGLWRFFDIKRLNGAENANIEIRRKILSDPTDPASVTELVIPANDPRWALPIYTTECELMGWEQNKGWE